jgi:hypothetical protein
VAIRALYEPAEIAGWFNTRIALNSTLIGPIEPQSFYIVTGVCINWPAISSFQELLKFDDFTGEV